MWVCFDPHLLYGVMVHGVWPGRVQNLYVDALRLLACAQRGLGECSRMMRRRLFSTLEPQEPVWLTNVRIFFLPLIHPSPLPARIIMLAHHQAGWRRPAAR